MCFFKKIFRSISQQLLLILSLLIFSGSNTAFSDILTVPGMYPTIQSAINASVNGDIVLVDPGVYLETPSITTSISLIGTSPTNTIIRCPNSPLTNSFLYTTSGVTYYPVLTVNNVSNVNIENLTIDGDNQGANAPAFFVGIGLHNSGGVIRNVNVTNIIDPTSPNNPLTGNGIQLAIDTGTFNISVLNSTLSRVQRTYLSARGSGLTLFADGNTLTGRTGLAPGTPAQNGISLLDTATGIISNNTVSQMQCATSPTNSVGILPFNAGPNVQILSNTVTQCDIAIASVNTGNNLLVQSNQTNNNTTALAIGIFIQEPGGSTTLSNNTLIDNAGIGMLLDSSTLMNMDPDTPSVFAPTFVPNPPFFMSQNYFSGGPIGLEVEGTGAAGPIVSMDRDVFENQSQYFVVMNGCPNNIWPTTDTVSFNGLISGVNMSFAQYQQTLTQIIDQHDDPALGLVLAFIEAPILPPSNFYGNLKFDPFYASKCCKLTMTWDPSPSANLVSYRIFENGKLIQTIPESEPRIYQIKLPCCQAQRNQFTIAAVNSDGLQSELKPLNIVRNCPRY